MKNGFSLVELSIVLVILGLLVGGILAGQSLIRAAELRSVSTEYSRYSTAVGAFKDKYFSVPGDMSNATSFWGAAGTCPGTNASPSTSAATCNGDGNGQIKADATTANEVYRFWQHLANAGLIEGSYTGVTNFGTADYIYSKIGTNVPRSKMNSGGWDVYYLGSIAISNTTYFDGSYSNAFFFGGEIGGGTDVVRGTILKPEEAWNIDSKIDDGKPATGIVRTWESMGSGACSDLANSNSSSLTAAVYQLNWNAYTCAFIIKTGY